MKNPIEASLIEKSDFKLGEPQGERAKFVTKANSIMREVNYLKEKKYLAKEKPYKAGYVAEGKKCKT